MPAFAKKDLPKGEFRNIYFLLLLSCEDTLWPSSFWSSLAEEKTRGKGVIYIPGEQIGG